MILSKEITLNGKYGIGKVVIVDDEDYEKLSFWNWQISPNGYVTRLFNIENGQRKRVLMHRLIMNAPDDKFVDHINHNKLDNRKSNLRLCTNQENQFNQQIKENKLTEYKGVVKRKNTFEVNVHHEYIGSFGTEIAAANAYNYYAQKMYGEFAFLNEVPYMSKDEWEQEDCSRNFASKYLGVGIVNKTGKYRARVGNKHLGCFNSEVDAAKAYNQYITDNNLDKPLNIIT